MQAIVLAARGGQEFGPLCQGSSKGMLPFLGEPLLAHVVRYLGRQGIEQVRVNLCQQPYAVERHFADHPPAVEKTTFHLEPSASGTAAAVRRLGGGAKETLVVSMGDLLMDVDLDAVHAFHKQRNALVTLVLVSGDRAETSGRATLGEDGRVTAFAEGSNDRQMLVNTGLYLIEPEALVLVPQGSCDFAHDFFPLLLEKNMGVYGYQTDGYWVDAGHPVGYAKALEDALAGRIPHVTPPGREVTPGVWVEAGSYVHPKAKLEAPCFVANGARLDQEAKLGPAAAAERGSRMGRGASVSHGVVFPDTYLGKATRWDAKLLYPDGLVDLQAAGAPVVRATPGAEVLGTTYREPLSFLLHTLFDQLLALAGLFVLAPALLLIILAIKLESPGPAFYTQLRVGRDRRPYRHGTPTGSIFEVFKFRTMHVNADAKVAELMAQNQYKGGAFFKLEHDPRITRVGDFLRKSSLDELPQLINVLLGEMRLVGNRPLPVYEAEALKEDWQRTRFLAPAGITGLWQISGRSELSEKERLALDAYYTVTRTFKSDMSILIRTVPALLARRGAR